MVNESGEDYNDLSKEMLILTATRELYYSENCPYADAKTNKEYEITLTPEEMIEKYSDLFGINKNIALSIAYCECGSSMNSHNYLANNNTAGLGPHMYFENKEIGIIYFINLLKERYGCTKDSGIEFLNKIAGTYCAQPSHWLSLTTPYYNSISNNYYYNVPEKNKKNNTKKLKK